MYCIGFVWICFGLVLVQIKATQIETGLMNYPQHHNTGVFPTVELNFLSIENFILPISAQTPEYTNELICASG
jgi:hypothetical protein